MAKYSTPGIRFTEIDNSIRTESSPGNGIGAIVMKSNKGPVNQRIVTKNYGEFTEIFGQPESLTDYGHFAAENYFANSTQLFAVRATMGDEQYSQIQYSFPDANVTATNRSKDTAKIIYVNNQGDNGLELLSPLSAVSEVEPLIMNDWVEENGEDGVQGFTLKQSAYYARFNDIVSETSDLIVFKSTNEGPEGTIIDKGYHVTYPTHVDSQGNDVQLDTKLMITEDAWNETIAPSQITSANKNGIPKISISVPASATLNRNATKIIFYANSAAVEGWTETGIPSGENGGYQAIFNDEVFYGNFSGSWTDPDEDGYGYTPAQYMEIMDWDDTDLKKTYYVDTDPFEETCHQAYGMCFTEYFNVDETYTIIGKKELDEKPGADFYFCKSVSEMYKDKDETPHSYYGNDDIPERTAKQVIIDIMDSYGCNDISDINKYYYLKYYDVFNDCIIEKVIKESPDEMKKKEHLEPNLFWLWAAKGNTKFTKKAVYVASDVENIVLPIQDGYVYVDEDTSEEVPLNAMVATPTSYILNSVDKTYADGYTIKTDSEDEPGNGDIERYNSVFDNQLTIASIGPGKYGDDIGISIITTECAQIKALNHQNAFNWKYRYDDEDQVNNDVEGLTWKKVFRINVYVKDKTQTAQGAWGFGMDALLREPVESWFVSTDPLAKDAEGNSLYVPTVINGHSEYIYVSRSSTTRAVNSRGEYEQPNQTYAIYQLTGGKNSVKNNISEKTAALNLYRDRQRAKFDILFNCDAIDTFNGKQRFNAHQRKIAEIAAARTMDIGVVQVTSKEAKTAKSMVSEAKMFSFNNGSYVAEYGGYDKYYNGTIASWVYLPKSVAGACAMAYCDTFAYPWFAPAGVARGTINYTNGQLLKLTDDEIGQLYDNNVNTTRDCGPYGVVLWGQKTALKKNSLLNRINVRRCLNYIEKNLENMMTPYLFMQNSVNTRSSARNDIDSFLQRVKAAEGLDSYSVSVTQDAEDPTIMNVNIQLVPTAAIEFIDVKITINRNKGVSVEEA